jgi:hypothetical protein
MKDGGDLSPQNKAMSTGDVHAHCSKHYQNFQSREKNNNNKSRENMQRGTVIKTWILHTAVLPVKYECTAPSLYVSVHTYSITGISIKFLYSRAFQTVVREVI